MGLYERPETVFVAGFIGSPSMNLIAATISGDGHRAELPGGSELALGDGFAPSSGRRVTLGLRPEHLRPADDGDAGLRFAVQLVEHLGADTLAHGVLGENGDDITLRLAGISRIAVGDSLALTIEPGNVHVFDHDSGKRLP